MFFRSDIFKAYDIRGKFPEEINEKVAERLGRAMVLYVSKKQRAKTVTLLICHDVRRSSPPLKQALAHGILSQGGNVIDAGIGTTPYFYYLMHSVASDGGIMVTASHNPPEYNGFKFRDGRGRPISSGSGLEKIKVLSTRQKTTGLPVDEWRSSARDFAPRANLRLDRKRRYHGLASGASFRKQIRQNFFQKNLGGQAKATKQEFGTVSLLDDRRQKYLDFISQKVRIKKEIRAVVDAAGGATAYFLPDLFRRFPNISYKPLFFEPDGTFKKHPPNPMLKDAQKHVIESLQKGSFDVGVLFDGDGDRAFFFDELGNPVSSEFVFGLFARRALEKRRGEKFVFTVNTSKGVREFVAEKGGKIIMSPVGFAFASPLVEKHRAYGGTEISGHFYFRDFFNDDSGFLAMLKLFEALSRERAPFSRLVAPMQRYVSSGELNFHGQDKKMILQKIRRHYKKQGARVSLLDGLTVEFPDWWASVRASNTEPLIRVVVEAAHTVILDKKTKEFEQLIK